MNQFICYSKCSTCQKAKQFLIDHNIEFEYREIKENPPTVEEVKNYILMSGKGIKSFFNTSGLIYKELELKDKLAFMSEDEKLVLLSTHGMLIKRPILVGNNKVLVGFKEQEYKEFVGEEYA